MVVKGLVGSSKHINAEALKLFIAVDTARALVTMCELAQLREVHPIVPPNFNKKVFCKAHLCVRRRRCPDVQPGRARDAKAVRGFVNNPERRMATAVDAGVLDSNYFERKSGLSCTKKWKQVSKTTEVKWWPEEDIWLEGSPREKITSRPKKEVQAFDRRSAVREGVLCQLGGRT